MFAIFHVRHVMDLHPMTALNVLTEELLQLMENAHPRTQLRIAIKELMRLRASIAGLTTSLTLHQRPAKL